MCGWIGLAEFSAGFDGVLVWLWVVDCIGLMCIGLVTVLWVWCVCVLATVFLFVGSGCVSCVLVVV